MYINNENIRGFIEKYFKESPKEMENISEWNVSKVTNMEGLFQNLENFNEDISKWDVSNVTNMSFMFSGATSFNQDIGGWKVCNVTNMSFMFLGATRFNQDIKNWDVSNVTNMEGMFSGATSFNQDIGGWKVCNVTDMSNMFSEATSFNQPLNSWDVSNVTNMSFMFSEATSFNQPLNSWDVSNVTNMSYMFDTATSFNGDISSWDLSDVTNMSNMFQNTTDLGYSLTNKYNHILDYLIDKRRIINEEPALYVLDLSNNKIINESTNEEYNNYFKLYIDFYKKDNKFFEKYSRIDIGQGVDYGACSNTLLTKLSNELKTYFQCDESGMCNSFKTKINDLKTGEPNTDKPNELKIFGMILGYYVLNVAKLTFNIDFILLFILMNPTNKYINKFIDEIVNGDVVETNDVVVMIDNEETKEEEENKKTDPTDTNNSNEEEDKKKFLNEIKKNIHQNEYNNNDELYKHCFQDISVEEYKKPKKPKDPKDPKDSKEKNERCILDQVEGTELQEYNNLLDYHTKHKIKTIFNIGDDLNEIPKEKIKIIIKNMSEGFKEIIDYINSNILKPDKRLHLYECINILKIRLRNKDTLLNSLKFENEGHNKENYNFIKQQILNIINDEIERVNNKRKIDEDKVIDIKEKNIDSFISKFNEQYTGKAYLRDNEKIVLKIKNIEKNSIVKTHACFNEIDINIPDKKITSKKKILKRFKKQLSFEPGFLDSLKMSLLDNSNYNMA